MKKTLIISLLGALMIFTQVTAQAAIKDSKINANAAIKKLEAGTILKVRLQEPIGTAYLKTGAPFTVTVMEDIKEGKKIVVPQGTLIRGSLSDVSPAKRFSKGAALGMYFDHIVSPSGKQIPIDIALCNNKYLTYDGKLSTKTNYGTAIRQNAQTAKNIITKSTTWSWEKGDDLFNGFPKYIFAPVTAIFATPVAGLYFVGDAVVDMIKKGDEIAINQGEILYVYLVNSVDLPVY
ncbi:hypothetical protein IKQ26_08995 [bacterium]|nr:hypothetical protein [bacterium]